MTGSKPLYRRSRQAASITDASTGHPGLSPPAPWRSSPFLGAALRSALERQGCRPYDLPLTWSEDPEDPAAYAECSVWPPP